MPRNQAVYDSGGSYLSLFNPLSPLTGGVDRVPGFMRGLTGSSRGDWLLAKMGAVGLLAAAGAATARGIKQLLLNDHGEDKDNPAYRLQEQISSVVEPDYGMGKKADYKAPDWNSLENIGNLALPLICAGLGVYTGWRGMGREIADSKDNELDNAIERKHRQVWQLIKTRARLAGGKASADEVTEALQDGDSGYTQKIASLNKTAVNWREAGRGAISLTGVTLLALAGMSALGSYKYFKSTNENNARYKDIQKGLREYAKQRALSTPITVNPVDYEEFLASIDEDTGKEADNKSDIRKTPEMGDANAPISVTL